MKRLFGTDGIRGTANAYPITPEVALQVGKAIALHFGAQGHGEMKVVIGKDTRVSGYMLEMALTSGLVSMGMDALLAGPVPTPAIAHLTKSMGASCGIMITASHNPWQDNGIKIFGPDGFKLPDEVELEIEEHILNGDIQHESDHVVHEIGKAYRIDDARGRYIEFAKSSIKNHSLKGLKIVLDCANGAAYAIAPLIFKELGAEVITLSHTPDGKNINDQCGALHPENAAQKVLECGADLGITLDGDADRVIFVDSQGEVVNGDRIIGMVALAYKKRGILNQNTLVLTSMSNMGLVKAMEENGIKVLTADVGDRYVIEAMRANHCNVGGEQSGHIIFMDYVTTGDGIITALHVLKILSENHATLREMSHFMSEFPQTMKSIVVAKKTPIAELEKLSHTIKACELALAGKGRAIIRYSGTENKIRVLIEAEEQSMVDLWIDAFADVIKEELF